MAYQSKYRLDYNTNAGSDINWRLDIEQFNYTGTIQEVVGGSEPVVIKYIGHNDIYSPIIASKATITLVTTDDDTYDDFTALTDANGTLDARAYRTTLYTVESQEQITEPLEFNDNQLMIGDVLRVVSSGTYDGKVEMTVMDTNSSDPADRISQTNLESVLEVGDFIVVGGERYEVLFIGAFSDGVDARLVIDKESISGLASNDNLNLETQAEGETSTIYWRGFISPQDSQVTFNTTPFEIELVATDGINLIADTKLAPFTDTDPDTQAKVGDYILDAIKETGTQLPVRCYHDMRTLIDANVHFAIMDTEASDYAYYDQNFFATKNKVEAMEDVLKTFNARIFQSDGAWCIISNSNHGGSISNNAESTSYQNYTYNSSTDVYDLGNVVSVANILKRFPDTLTPAMSDLDTEHRRPYFSIERDITTQRGLPVSTNSFFSEDVSTIDDTPGPVWRNTFFRSDGTAPYGETRTAHPANAVDSRGSHYVSTTGVNANSGRDLWFESNINIRDVYEFEKTASIIWRHNWSDADVDRVEIGVQLACEIHGDDQTDWYFYNFDANEWDWRNSNRSGNKNQYWNYTNTTRDDRNVWLSESFGSELGKGRAQSGLSRFLRNISRQIVRNPIPVLLSFVSPVSALANVANIVKTYQLYNAIQQTIGNTDDDLIFKIRIGDIRVFNSSGDRITTNGVVTTDIDAVTMEYETETAQPFFERYQTQFNETYSDTVGLVSEGPNIYRGSLSQEEYYRANKGASDEQSLESLVSLQKLNDYRVPLKFYDGKFIPETGVLHLVDKIQNNFSGSDGDDVSCIQQYLELRTKSNEYTSKMYLRNQEDDVSSTFGMEDVYPQFASYTWRDTRINHDIDLDLTSVTLPSTGGIETALNGAVSAEATSITVDDTDDFPDSGWLVVGSSNDYVMYTGKTGTTFTGIPAEGPGAISAHADNTTVVAGINAYISTGLPTYKNADDEEEYGRWFIRYADVEADEDIRQVIELFPSDDSAWEINASNFDISNSSDIEAEEVEIYDTGVGVRLTFSTTTTDVSQEIAVNVSGEVDALSTSSVSYTVTKGTEPTGVTVTVADGGNLPANSTEFLLVYYTPDASDKEITLDNASITATAFDSDDNELDDVVGTIAETAFGTGVQYVIPITHDDNLDDITLAFTATTSDLSDGVTTAQLTINATEGGTSGDDSSTDPDKWSFTGPVFPVTGVTGTEQELAFEVNADDGYVITDVSVAETATEILSTRLQTITRHETILWVKVRFPAANATASMVITGTTSDDDGEEVDHTIIKPAATDGWDYTRSGNIVLGVDPYETGVTSFSIEGDDGYDVSGITFAVPAAATWLELIDTTTYTVSGRLTTGKTFYLQVTGQEEAPDDVTLTLSGSATEVPTIDLVMNLDATTSGMASVDKTHLKWTYSEEVAGEALAADRVGTAQYFTVESNNPLLQYQNSNDFSAGAYNIEGSTNGSSAVGTLDIDKGAFQSGTFVADVAPNNSANDTPGQFAFRVTPTFGTTVPTDGTYDGYITLDENNIHYVSATTGALSTPDATVSSPAQNVPISVTGVDGNWIVTRPSADATIVPTISHGGVNTKAGDAIINAAFTTNTSSSRTVTFSLFETPDGTEANIPAGATALATLTITQSAPTWNDTFIYRTNSQGDPSSGDSDGLYFIAE